MENHQYFQWENPRTFYGHPLFLWENRSFLMGKSTISMVIFLRKKMLTFPERLRKLRALTQPSFSSSKVLREEAARQREQQAGRLVFGRVLTGS